MKCAKLANFGQSGTNLDELIAYPVDLSGVTAGSGGVTLSFRYAHRKRLSADSECLKVFITSNCGDTWAQRKLFVVPFCHQLPSQLLGRLLVRQIGQQFT